MWDVWPTVWASTQEKIIHMVLRILNETVDEMVALATRELAAMFVDNKNQLVEGVVSELIYVLSTSVSTSKSPWL
jgi:uncharacterized membrane protein